MISTDCETGRIYLRIQVRTNSQTKGGLKRDWRELSPHARVFRVGYRCEARACVRENKKTTVLQSDFNDRLISDE